MPLSNSKAHRPCDEQFYLAGKSIPTFKTEVNRFHYITVIMFENLYGVRLGKSAFK